MKKIILTTVVLVAALAAAGTASAAKVLPPGHCTKVAGVKICAAKAKTKTVVVAPVSCVAALNDADSINSTNDVLIGLAAQALGVASQAITDLAYGNLAGLQADTAALDAISPQIQAAQATKQQKIDQYQTDSAACRAASGV